MTKASSLRSLFPSKGEDMNSRCTEDFSVVLSLSLPPQSSSSGVPEPWLTRFDGRPIWLYRRVQAYVVWRDVP